MSSLRFEQNLDDIARFPAIVGDGALAAACWKCYRQVMQFRMGSFRARMSQRKIKFPMCVEW
eukprot:337352-Alexandrium_andersonii.AAC.1